MAEENSTDSSGFQKSFSSGAVLSNEESPSSYIASPVMSGPQTRTSFLSQSYLDSKQTRRSSTRSIKRKKFDDELVESSLIKSDRGRLKPPDQKPESQPQEPSPTPAPPPPKKKKVPTATLR